MQGAVDAQSGQREPQQEEEGRARRRPTATQAKGEQFARPSPLTVISIPACTAKKVSRKIAGFANAICADLKHRGLFS